MNKFVIIGPARSGTTLLQNLLWSHKQIISFNELCNPELNDDLPEDQDEAVSYIMNEVYNQNQHLTRGFKMLYEHSKNNKKVWSTLLDPKNSIKFIHLIRENKLRQFISYKQSMKEKIWNSTNKDDIRSESIEVCTKELKAYVKTLRNQEKKIDNDISDLSSIKVSYEQLTQNQEKTLEKIQNFLNVDVQNLETDLVKLNKMTLKESIENYEEVKEII